MKRPQKGKWYMSHFIGVRSPWEYKGFNPYIQVCCFKLKVDLPKESLLSKNDYIGFIWKIQPFNWYHKLPQIDKVIMVNQKLRYTVWKLTKKTLPRVYVISYKKFW